MIDTYLTNITPDSVSGLLFGFEGIKNTVVLLNGPTGCKFYHSATSDNQMLRQQEFDPLNYPELWYFGQPRIPCTFLDKRDYVYGSKEKLTEAVRFLRKNLQFDLLVVVNAPGAALIGDDLFQIVAAESGDTPVITVETPGYSHHIWEGYSSACLSVVEKFAGSCGRAERETEKKTVNILGLSIFHKYYEGDLLELRRLLRLCRIEVNCALCCECSLDEIRKLPQADLNIVLDPAYGLPAAEKLAELYKTPYLLCDGLPVGFSAAEQFLSQLCNRLNADGGSFVTESEKSRARAYIYLSRLNSLTGLPKGAKFAVQGTAAQCLGYCRFFIKYFGMIADCVCVFDESTSPSARSLKLLLDHYKMGEAMEKDILRTDAQLVFADGNIIARLKARRHSFSGIEISLPSLGYTDVLPKTHLGLNGGLLLCEQIINGLPF